MVVLPTGKGGLNNVSMRSKEGLRGQTRNRWPERRTDEQARSEIRFHRPLIRAVEGGKLEIQVLRSAEMGFWRQAKKRGSRNCRGEGGWGGASMRRASPRFVFASNGV
jgi:hypothetical protein